MTEKIKRYEVFCIENQVFCEQKEDGDYCDSSDVEALESLCSAQELNTKTQRARIEQLEKELEELRGIRIEPNPLKNSLEKALKENERLKEKYNELHMQTMGSMGYKQLMEHYCIKKVENEELKKDLVIANRAIELIAIQTKCYQCDYLTDCPAYTKTNEGWCQNVTGCREHFTSKAKELVEKEK